MIRHVSVMLLALLTGTPALAGLCREAPRPRADDPPTDSGKLAPIAVVDFACAAGVDPRDEWLATACEETLCMRLRAESGLVVIPTVRAYLARRELQDGESAEPPRWERVVELLGARRQVSGIVSGMPSACELTVRIHQRGRAEPIDARTFGPDRLATVLERAAEWLAGALGGEPRQPHEPRVAEDAGGTGAANASDRNAAWWGTLAGIEYYAKAVMAARREQVGDAAYYLERAVQVDAAPAAHLMLAEIELRSGRERQQAGLSRLRQVRDVARQRGAAHTALEAELALATMLVASDSHEAAQLRLDAALETARRLEDPYAELGVLAAVCDAHLRREARPDPGLSEPARRELRQAQLQAAAAALERSLALLERLGDQVGQAPLANKLALVYERLEDAPRALRMHERTLACAQRIGSRRTEATARMFLGQWHKRAGDYAAARAALERCLELAEPAARPQVRIALADVLEQQGQAEAALGMYDEAYRALFDSEDLASQLLCLEAIARLAEGLGRRDRAVAALRDAVDVAEVLQLPRAAGLRERLSALGG